MMKPLAWWKNNLDTARNEDMPMTSIRAGAARVDITPELGHNLAGWIDVRPAMRQATPILGHALVLASDQSQILMLTCDLLEIDMALGKRFADRIDQECGIPARHIFILPSHNHYGPSLTGNYAGDAQRTFQESAYIEGLIDRLCAAASTASSRLEPAHLGIGYGEERKISHNSRFWRKDGTINWVGDRATHFARESGPLDPQLGVLRIFSEQGHTIATLYNFACHANAAEPDGFTTISWDWPGYASQTIEDSLGGEAFFLPGACGNTHPIQEGTAREMGKTLAGKAIEAAQSTVPIDPAPVFIKQRELNLPARDFTTFDPRQIETICAQLWDDETRIAVQAIFMKVLEDVKTNPITHLTGRIRTVTIGDLAIVFIPGELFTELGLEIKERSPFKHTFVVETLSESLGYLPTRKAYEQGGYQPAVGTRVAPGGGEMIGDAALAMLKNMAS
jgi:neutral ceramidase